VRLDGAVKVARREGREHVGRRVCAWRCILGHFTFEIDDAVSWSVVLGQAEELEDPPVVILVSVNIDVQQSPTERLPKIEVRKKYCE
jgi:hypothetical protein